MEGKSNRGMLEEYFSRGNSVCKGCGVGVCFYSVRIALD